MSRGARGCAALALAGAVLAAYLAGVLLPRVRAAVPDPDDLPGRLLAGSPLPRVLWVAHPQQNLAAARGAVGDGDWDEFVAALGRRTGQAAPKIPGFGPFAAPPARELAVAADAEGRRFFAAARVDPLLAVVARLAGKLAANPWLGGGAVEISGRPAAVRWSGTLWTAGNLSADEALGAGTTAAAPAGDPALAVLRLAAGTGMLPAGRYRLSRQAGGLRLATGGGTPPAPAGDRLARLGVSLFAVAGPGGPLGAGRGGFALFDEPGGAAAAALPPAAVWVGGGGGRFSLPGGGLASLLGGGGSRGGGNSAAWTTVATGRDARRRADELSPEVASLAARLRFGLWVEPAAALAAVRRTERLLDAVPLVSRVEVRRWRDWQTLLAPLAACEHLALGVTGEAFRLDLVACDGGS